MRMLYWMILAEATILVVVPATALRYDPRYPVCLQSWHKRGLIIVDCSYTSMDQCRMTASGLSAMCLENPYWRGSPGHNSRRRQGGVY
ncbi:DUF3551 domain-containing protein [Bradyrhizobium manausense]|uniref:DUF3551 domain-containing protein n=1 Tax=Bradyrhizobium manausense TaxID=989370 RepID=UPI001BA8BF66|nr:DUF3551 domain-containing protein [Bradyrhizobium manausense]MBR0824070.1 DUF3551 domain-containing protein [Bradyrhizobium manausense]